MTSLPLAGGGREVCGGRQRWKFRVRCSFSLLLVVLALAESGIIPGFPSSVVVCPLSCYGYLRESQTIFFGSDQDVVNVTVKFPSCGALDILDLRIRDIRRKTEPVVDSLGATWNKMHYTYYYKDKAIVFMVTGNSTSILMRKWKLPKECEYDHLLDLKFFFPRSARIGRECSNPRNGTLFTWNQGSTTKVDPSIIDQHFSSKNNVELPRLPALPDFAYKPQLIHFSYKPRLPTLSNFSYKPRLPALPDFSYKPRLPALPDFFHKPRLPALRNFTYKPQLPPLPDFSSKNVKNMSYNSHIAYLPVGLILFMMTVCISICIGLSQTPIMQRMRANTVVRVLVESCPTSAAPGKENHHPPASDSPPTYNDIEKADAPPPSYAEILKDYILPKETTTGSQQETLVQIEMPVADSVKEPTDATTATPAEHKTSSMKSEVTTAKSNNVKTQSSFRSLKEEK